MKLYDLELSGNCYKVRLFAALAGIDLELEPVDLPGGCLLYTSPSPRD